MSLLQKKWILPKTKQLLSPFYQICSARGLKTTDEINNYINPQSDDLFDPWLFKDMDKAVQRVIYAINKKERIMIFGDYDVDGISSTAILYTALKKMKAQVSYRLPHRVNDGYGLNQKFIDECSHIKVDLIITVDCGIANIKEINYAKDLEIEVIITDHHTIPPKLPPALAIVNPKQTDCNYPFKEICGALVAYKLATALSQKLLQKTQAKSLLSSLEELVCLGIVADITPLVSENRTLVKKGLLKLQTSNNSGIKEMLKLARVKANQINCETIGFIIGPRLNAAGRIAHPYYSLEVLLGNKKKASLLEKLNRERQNKVQQALKTLDNKIDPSQNILISQHEDLHIGIIGILAGKLVEKYARPSLVLQSKGDFYVGSARSTCSVDLMSLLGQFKDFFSHFGGHSQAAGLSISKKLFPKFKKTIEKYAKTNFSVTDFQSILNIDSIVNKHDLNWSLLDEINQLAPFGVGNPKPRLMLKNIQTYDHQVLGIQKQHLKMKTKINNQYIDIIGFNLAEYINKIKKSSQINLVFELDQNNWRNKKSLQLKMIDALCL